MSSMVILSVGTKMADETCPESTGSAVARTQVSVQGGWLWVLDSVHDTISATPAFSSPFVIVRFQSIEILPADSFSTWGGLEQ